jgi:hypothetical protein
LNIKPSDALDCVNNNLCGKRFLELTASLMQIVIWAKRGVFKKYAMAYFYLKVVPFTLPLAAL